MSTQTIFLTAGSTSKSVDLFLVQKAAATSPGDPLTGLAFNTSSFTAYYRKGQTGTLTSITLATQTVGGAYSSGGFVEISSTNAPGAYRFDIPDTVIATAGEANITFNGAANLATHMLKIIVTAVDLYDSVRMGMTALPNAAAAASGGLFIRGSGAGAINQDANGRIDVNITAFGGSAGTFSSGRPEVNTTHWGGNALSGGTGQLDGLGVLDRGTAQSVTGTTIVLRSAAAFADSELIGSTVYIKSATTGAGQARVITAYTGSTDTATVDAWTTTPTGTIVYEIYAGSPASATLVPNVNVAQISGDATAADNLETMLDGTGGQTLSLGALTVSGATTLTGNVAAAAGVTITQSTTNGHGISVTGNGTGNGINAVGGATGNGIRGLGGSTSGDGIVAAGQTSGHGLTATGVGTTKHGVNATGGATTSAGIAATGGSTSGDGLLIAAATSGHGISTSGAGTTKHGIHAAGGATTSHGINAIGGGTGNGAQFTSGSGATGQGMNITSAATNGSALVCTAAGTGTGLSATGGASGKGALLAAGATGTAGLAITGGGTSGAGMTVTTTAGDAIQAIATAGHGMSLTANGTSKHGLVATGGTAGTSDGIKGVAGTGGIDIRGDITANAMVESYPADGAAPTIAQALMLTMQSVGEVSVSGTTMTIKKLDGSTTAATYTLDSATTPTSRTRAS